MTKAGLPTLYKKTATGAQQEWSVHVEDNVIVTRWGQTGGAIQEGRDVVAEGKNRGRKNETTAAEQAQLEAKALWEKKKKKGYHEIAEAAMVGATDALIEGGIFPMLAHDYAKHGHKITWPAYAQPKLDGHRCIAVLKDGQCSLWSRTRKRITGVPHIERAVEATGLGDIVLDGELYAHQHRDSFEELTSFIRQETPKAGHEIVEYHCYDLPSAEGGFSARHATLCAQLQHAGLPLRTVETVLVEDEDALMAAFERFSEQGYEGAIVRNAEGPYMNRRSYDLLKVKEFEDQEFEVVGVAEGRGKLAGHAIFVCRTADGKQFQAKMIGELEGLRRYVEDPGLAIGKMLTVKYQGLTRANGVPRFPVALRFRQDP